MNTKVVVGTNTLVLMARQLHSRGELSDDEMKVIEARNQIVPEEHKKDVVELS